MRTRSLTGRLEQRLTQKTGIMRYQRPQRETVGRVTFLTGLATPDDEAFCKSANHRENLIDRRLVKHQTGKRQIVVVMGELARFSTLAPAPTAPSFHPASPPRLHGDAPNVRR